MKAIVYNKSIPRFAWVRLVSRLGPSWALGPGSLVQMSEVDPPTLPGPRWVRIRPRLSGICGSDLATVRASGSPYFSPVVSTPFVPGHEVVGIVEETGPDVTTVQRNDRVIIEPVLHCAVRDVPNPCPPCRDGDTGRCEMLDRGTIDAGVQTGYCRSTGGGWSGSVTAHEIQCHEVPEGWSDETAVLVEPLACATHVAASHPPEQDETVLVLGCGTMGLLTIACLRALGHENTILASALQNHQKKIALQLGATEIVPVGHDLYLDLTTRTNARILRPDVGAPFLSHGVDCVYDCVASSGTLHQSLRIARPGGRVILVGMPGIPFGVDWTAIWHRELRVQGVYAYGQEIIDGKPRRTFDLAMEIMERERERLQPLLTHRYPLDDYRKALGLALSGGKDGSVKVAFEIGEA